MSDARTALEAIGQLPDSEIDIADAALQLARIDAPDADWQAARLHLSELARDAAALPAGDEDLAARAGALAGLITGRHGYTGDSETYEDLANANLIRVIERRRGMPVAWRHQTDCPQRTATSVLTCSPRSSSIQKCPGVR